VTPAKKPKKPAEKEPLTPSKTAGPTPTARTRAAPSQQAMTSSTMGIGIEWTEKHARGGWRQWR
jgi:hypothetical protein